MDLKKENLIKGRGAQINTPDPFTKLNYSTFEGEIDHKLSQRTSYIPVHPKTIVNPVNSPDLFFNYSINPYQGCEHGCVYCYARNTHPYWGYSAGQEFEQKILYKASAPKLLATFLQRKKWKAELIMLSGNTDCYQPIEKKMKITRSLLEVFYKYRHPVGIITKNSLIMRDADILEKLAKDNLVQVAISLTTENEELRQFMEPRTATARKKFEVIRQLTELGVPVNVMMAPIIPSLTDHEILSIAKKSADAGAIKFNYTMVRLNRDVATIFEDWLRKVLPDRADKILNKIKGAHQGQLGSSTWKERMRGSGNIAQIIRDQAELARKLYFQGRTAPEINYELHAGFKTDQMRLF